MTAWSITDVSLVLPRAVLPDAALHVVDGRIAWFGPRRELASVLGPGPHPLLEGGGRLLAPGIVDLHDDGLDRTLMPRTGAELPPQLAWRGHRAARLAHGITTTFHALAFRTTTALGGPRSPHVPATLLDLVGTPGARRPDDRLLCRVDVHDPAGWVDARRILDGVRGPVLLSMEDHTPGQGQYRDLQSFTRRVQRDEGLGEEEARQRIAHLQRRAHTSRDARDHLEQQVAQLLSERPDVIGVVHDPDSAARVDHAASLGARVAEFPTTVEAARRARERGLRVAVGSPNLVRGGSHCGNVSAGELARLGLVDLVVSDYAPMTLWPAIGILVKQGVPWPEAVGLVTSGPARTVGLSDRGVIAVGARADLVLLDAAELPWVTPTWVVAGEPAPCPATMDVDMPQ